jgi:hypothetical protein
VSSHKIYSKINESPQVHLEARDVLLDASNNLKTTIKEYKILFMQREETLSENYDTLIMKPHRYDSRKVSRLSSPSEPPLSRRPHFSVCQKADSGTEQFLSSGVVRRQHKTVELFPAEFQL